MSRAVAPCIARLPPCADRRRDPGLQRGRREQSGRGACGAGTCRCPGRVTAEHAAPAGAPQEHGAAAAGEHSTAGEAEHAEGALPLIARIFNFAVLAGLLAYFLRTPLASYLASRHTEIREELVKAAETRAAATAQLAAVEQKVKALPAELDALRAQGAEDVVAERERISQATATERQRLLAHTRREIDMQLRLAKRALVEHGAQLAVDVAHTRIVNTITPEDQLRLVDRYAAQLKEAR